MGKRQEFSKAVKLAAWERCGGYCECGGHHKPLRIIRAEYDHWPVPATWDGPATLENCRVLDVRCHRGITNATDIPKIAKATRVDEKRAGLRKTRRPFPKRADPWGKAR